MNTVVPGVYRDLPGHHHHLRPGGPRGDHRPHPAGPAGARDVEGIMVFLASDDAAFATGALFAVDGGMTI